MRVDADSAPPSDWDAFVAAHAAGTAYHRSAAVRIGSDAFGLRTSFLAARDDAGSICGVLPLVEQSSLLFGRYLVSVPFFTYGGILASDPRAATALAQAAADLARRRRADHVELRHREHFADLGMPERRDKVSMLLELPRDEGALAKQLGSKLRSQIRRADRESPEVVWGGEELLPEFYSVFSGTMRDVGTPVYPRAFFGAVWRALSDSISILVVRAGGEAQAAAVVVRHRETIEVPWAGATPAAKRAALNMRMYWEMLAQAVHAGATAFDFGRSSVDSGTYRFKAQWGARATQLHWHYWLPAGAAIPVLNQSNPKYDLAAAMWKRMPLWCANLIGPRIARHLP